MTDKIRVCCGNKCSDRGSIRILEVIQENFEPSSIEPSECMKYCEHGPNIIIGDKIFHECRTRDIVSRIKNNEGQEMGKPDIDDLLLEGDLL